MTRKQKDFIVKMLKFLPDKLYIKLRFRYEVKQKLNLDNPKTFNEKMQWLKLYDRKPIYTTMVDKYLVKDYVANIIGEEYIIPTLGVWDKFEDIDFDSLPNEFVLKCTHDSGGLIIVKDKSKLDIKKAKRKINKSLKRNFYYNAREWPYKNVKPRIIAEKFMKDGDSEVLPVYKFMCFNGEPRIIQSIQNDKTQNETVDYFDTNWTQLNLKQRYDNNKTPLSCPNNLDEMLVLAKKLAKDKSFIRVDFYSIGGKIYFSEYTFYSDAGFSPFQPKEWDYKLGEMIKLPIDR